MKQNEEIFIGNCRNETLVEEIFGSVSEFARQVEEKGNSFWIDGVLVKYDHTTDIHSFWEKIDLFRGKM